jgi:thiol-disulfide isomerase/thioredoxin
MKNLIYFFLILLLVSCKNETTKVLFKESKPTIKILNYEQLEPYLNRSDDKTYVVNFWATWCKPCIDELPAFEKLHNIYKDKNVEVLLVSLDFKKDVETRLMPFLKKRNIQPDVILLDDTRESIWIPKIDENWSGAIPATLIYNTDQRSFYEQSFNYEELLTEVKKFLK